MSWAPEVVEGRRDGLAVTASFATCGAGVGHRVAVVSASGDIDLLTAPWWSSFLVRARRGLARAPRPGDGAGLPSRLVCDLGGVGFIDARGLAVLTETDARARAVGVELVLVVATRTVHRTLGIAGLDEAWPTYGSVSAAVAGPGGTAAPA